MHNKTRIEPAQHFGPVTEVVLVNYFGRLVSGAVKGTMIDIDDGKVLCWYIVDIGDDQPLMVALSTLKCVMPS